jgi:hypothetical protein
MSKDKSDGRSIMLALPRGAPNFSARHRQLPIEL